MFELLKQQNPWLNLANMIIYIINCLSTETGDEASKTGVQPLKSHQKMTFEEHYFALDFLFSSPRRTLPGVAPFSMSFSVGWSFWGITPIESIWTNRWVDNEMVYDLDPQATGSWLWLISLLGLPHSTTPLGLPHWPHSPVTIYWMVVQVWDNHWGLRIMIQYNTHIYI